MIKSGTVAIKGVFVLDAGARKFALESCGVSRKTAETHGIEIKEYDDLQFCRSERKKGVWGGLDV